MVRFNSQLVARFLFIFGISCGVLGVFTQYGLTYQVGTQKVFADPQFDFLLGILAILAGMYLRSDHSDWWMW